MEELSEEAQVVIAKEHTKTETMRYKAEKRRHKAENSVNRRPLVRGFGCLALIGVVAGALFVGFKEITGSVKENIAVTEQSSSQAIRDVEITANQNAITANSKGRLEVTTSMQIDARNVPLIGWALGVIKPPVGTDTTANIQDLFNIVAPGGSIVLEDVPVNNGQKTGNVNKWQTLATVNEDALYSELGNQTGIPESNDQLLVKLSGLFGDDGEAARVGLTTEMEEDTLRSVCGEKLTQTAAESEASTGVAVKASVLDEAIAYIVRTAEATTAENQQLGPAVITALHSLESEPIIVQYVNDKNEFVPPSRVLIPEPHAATSFTATKDNETLEFRSKITSCQMNQTTQNEIKSIEEGPGVSEAQSEIPYYVYSNQLTAHNRDQGAA
jgi:hypothetical protein